MSDKKPPAPIHLVPRANHGIAAYVHDLDNAIVAAIQLATSRAVPQGYIVAVLAGHSLVQTQRLIGPDT